MNVGVCVKELGRRKEDPTQQPVKCTDKFHVIRFDDIPPAKRREVCHTSVVCEIRADKDGPNRT